jgi:hypothetical protein
MENVAVPLLEIVAFTGCVVILISVNIVSVAAFVSVVNTPLVI